jgi:hypothetical protein
LVHFRLTEEQKALVKEFALLERNTPGTIDGLGDIKREKDERRETEHHKSGHEEQVGKAEEKPEQKPGILSRIKNAIFG